MKCPTCEGKGGWGYYISYPDMHVFEECLRCKETGKVGIVEWLQHQFWSRVPVRFVEWCADIMYREE